MQLQNQNNIVNDTDNQFNLFHLIASSNFEKLKELFDIHYYPDINITKSSNQNGLFTAVTEIQDDEICLKMVDFLIKKGMDPLLNDSNNQTILYYTCAAGLLKTTQYLCENFPFNPLHTDTLKKTPLFYAAKFNRLEIVKYLYSKGFEMNHVDIRGENCLFSIKGNNGWKLVKFLIDKGVKWDVIGKEGISFVAYANKMGWYNVVNVINGLDCEKQNNEEINCYMIVNKDTFLPLKDEEMKTFISENIDLYQMLMDDNQDDICDPSNQEFNNNITHRNEYEDDLHNCPNSNNNVNYPNNSNTNIRNSGGINNSNQDHIMAVDDYAEREENKKMDEENTNNNMMVKNDIQDEDESKEIINIKS